MNNIAVQIKNPTEGCQNKLKGFISKTANRPNTFNSDYEFDGRSYKLYAEGGKKVFNIDTVYLSLYPEMDMTTQVSISFGESKIQMNEAYQKYKKQKQKAIEENNQIILQQTREREHKVQESIYNEKQNLKNSSLFGYVSQTNSPLQSSKNLTVFNKSEFQQYKDQRSMIKSCDGKRKNITIFNKFNMASMFDKYEKLLRQKEDNQTKINVVQERKNQICQDKYSEVEGKFRMSCLRSQFQIEKKKMVERNSKFQLFQFVWLKFIKQMIVLKELHDKLKVIIKKKQICHKAKFTAIRAAAIFMKSYRIIGLYPEKRAISMSCIATNKFAQLIHRKCQKRAEYVVINYLQQSSIISNLKTKGSQFYLRVISIQRQWRETKQKKRRFKELIIRYFQSKYSDLLYEIRLDARKLKDPYFQPIVLLSQIVSNFLLRHLQKYQEMYESYRSSVRILLQMNEENKKNYSISVAFKKPIFFRLPNELEIKKLVKEYAEAKQLIN